MSDLSGEAFKASDVALHYSHRPPYAAQVYEALARQAPATGRLLDLGSGEGKIARPMSQVFAEVVAVDPSAPMIALGRSLEHGQSDNLTWVEAKAEDAPLQGQFDLVTFGSSIHWMAPGPLADMLRRHLKPDGTVAIVSGDEPFAPPWQADWEVFLKKWVPLVTGRPVGSPEWRAIRGQHLEILAENHAEEFISDPFRQSVNDLVLCQHSRNTFALEKLGPRARDFRNELTDLLAPYADERGEVTYRVKSRLVLARPKADAS